MKPWLAGGLLVLAVCRAASGDQSAMASLLKPLDLVGYRSATMPPHFSGHTVDARPLSIADLRGKVIVVNFWASWCLECRPEMPVLERLHRELASRGLAIVGLVLDPDSKINTLYGVIGLPTTFLVGRDGRAVAFAIGPREWGSAPARALIEALLAEPAPRPE